MGVGRLKVISSTLPKRSTHRLLMIPVLLVAFSAIFAACGSSGGSSGTSGGGTGKFRIALVMSYSGNEWQNASTNLIKALTKTPPWSEKVEFDLQIAGTDPQKQSKLITDEVSSGSDAIIVYPISPTAINTAERKACEREIIVINYDSWTTEPCSYNIHADIQKMATTRAKFVAEAVHGKGKVVEISGVPGTTFNTVHEEAVDEVLKEYPEIELVARENGEWSQPGAREAIAKLISAHPDLNGVITQLGCWGATQKLMDLGHKPLPCGGDMSTGHLRMMLPKGETPESIGLPSVGSSESTFTGALSFLQAYNMLVGGQEAVEKRCHETVITPHEATNETVSLGEDEKKPGNVFPPSYKPEISPEFLADFYSPLVGQGIKASLGGVSDQISKPAPPEEVGGDNTIDGVAEGKNCLVP